MASVKHTFVSTKPPNPDSTIISGDDWNDDHDLTDIESATGAQAKADAAQAAAEATAAGGLSGHLGDTVDAHDASAVSAVPFSTIAGTTVQLQLEEIFTEASGAHPNLATHDALGLATDAELTTHAATPHGGIVSYTKATLPAPNPTTPGTLARVTDDIRGLWRDTGTSWVSTTGGMDPRDFGADPTGATASDTAFADMMAVFPTNVGLAGVEICGYRGAYKLTKPWYVYRRALKFRGKGVSNPGNYSPTANHGHGTTLIWAGPTWKNIITITNGGSGTTVTVNATAHGFSTGDRVTISEVLQAGVLSTTYNGAYVVTVTDADHFTYTASGTPSSAGDAAIGICGFSMVIVEDSMEDFFEDTYFQGSASSPPIDLLYFNNVGGSVGSNQYQGARDCRFGSLSWTVPATVGTAGSPNITARNGIRYGGKNTNNDQYHYEYCHFREVLNGFVLDNSQSIWGILQSPEFMWCDKGVVTAANMEVHNPQFNLMRTAEFYLNSTAQVDVFGWQSERTTGQYLVMKASGSSFNVYGGQISVTTGYAQTNGFDVQSGGGQGGLRLDGLRINAAAVAGVVPNVKVRGNASSVPYYVTIIDSPAIALADLDIVADATGAGIYVTVLSREIAVRRFLTAGATLGTTVNEWEFIGNVVVGAAAIATTATDGFLYLPSCPGMPTGVPSTKTGRVPFVVDSTNGRLCAYIGGAWKYVEAS